MTTDPAVARGTRLACPSCGRDVAVRRVTARGLAVLHDHRRPKSGRGWCTQAPFAPALAEMGDPE